MARNFLDTDTDVFDDDFNFAGEELTAVNEFSCSSCENTYMTKGGLNRHVNKKHTVPVDDSLVCITLLNLISKPIQTLSEDLCLSLDRRCTFSSYIYPEEKVKKLSKKTKQRANYHSSENQAIITILRNTIVEHSSDQKLISVQNRGGLTAVTEDCRGAVVKGVEHISTIVLVNI